MQALIFILLYDDVVVLFACNLGDMQHLMCWQETTKLVDKTKMMTIMPYNQDNILLLHTRENQ